MIVPEILLCDGDEFIQFKVGLTKTKLHDEGNKAFNSLKDHTGSTVIEALKSIDSMIRKYNSERPEKNNIGIKLYVQIKVGEIRTWK